MPKNINAIDNQDIYNSFIDELGELGEWVCALIDIKENRNNLSKEDLVKEASTLVECLDMFLSNGGEEVKETLKEFEEQVDYVPIKWWSSTMMEWERQKNSERNKLNNKEL